LPPLDEPGWEGPVDVRVFTPDDLWEKINGRAEVYLAFHMVRMIFGTYRSSAAPDQYLDVFAYDMGEPDNAFGVYRAEMGLTTVQKDLGREGYAAPGGVFFWKGGQYVRVEAADDSEPLSAAALALAQRIESGITDEGKPLWADALLPVEDRVEGSFQYHATDAFSLEFLDNVFSADYRVGERSFQTFLHRADSADQAASLLEAYEAFFEEYGKLIKREPREGYELLVGESGGIVDAVVCVGTYLAGVSGGNDPGLAEQRVCSFADRLKDQASSGPATHPNQAGAG
jgi:hypothetical protein